MLCVDQFPPSQGRDVIVTLREMDGLSLIWGKDETATITTTTTPYDMLYTHTKKKPEGAERIGPKTIINNNTLSSETHTLSLSL